MAIGERRVWDPTNRRWYNPDYDPGPPEHKDPYAGMDRVIGVVGLIIAVCVVALTIHMNVGDGGNEAPMSTGRSPVASTASPSPTPTPAYAQWPVLEPGHAALARAAFYDLSAFERADICAFMTLEPKDAVAQAVRQGFPPRGARALVRFIVEELCS